MDSKNEIIKNFETNSDEIDLKKITRILKRKKFLVFSITTLITLGNIIITGHAIDLYC